MNNIDYKLDSIIKEKYNNIENFSIQDIKNIISKLSTYDKSEDITYIYDIIKKYGDIQNDNKIILDDIYIKLRERNTTSNLITRKSHTSLYDVVRLIIEDNLVCCLVYIYASSEYITLRSMSNSDIQEIKTYLQEYDEKEKLNIYYNKLLVDKLSNIFNILYNIDTLKSSKNEILKNNYKYKKFEFIDIFNNSSINITIFDSDKIS